MKISFIFLSIVLEKCNFSLSTYLIPPSVRGYYPQSKPVLPQLSTSCRYMPASTAYLVQPSWLSTSY